MSSIIDDVSLDQNAYFCHMADLTWVGGREPSGQTTMPCVSSFTLPTGVHISERSDLAVVRCREMERGEIFATKAAKCFSPLHAICVLAKAGDWQFHKLASSNSFTHGILCAWNASSLVVCFNLSFPT